MKRLFNTGIIALLILSGCSKNNVKPNDQNITGKVKVGEAFATGSGVKITLYQDTTFLTGYNKIYLTLSDSASTVALNNANVVVSTSMSMGMGMPDMIGPVEQPAYTSDQKLYAGACVFAMATGNGMAQWDIAVNVKNLATGKQGTANFMVNVNNAKYNFITTATGTDGQTYLITMLQPLKPQVGMNNFEILVDKQTDMMSYDPVNNFTIQFTPVMPAMDNMTSNNNVNPVLSANGHYVGKVNLTMTGDWKFNINLQNGQTSIVSGAAIEFTF